MEKLTDQSAVRKNKINKMNKMCADAADCNNKAWRVIRIRGVITRMFEAVSLKMVTLEKPHVTHGASIRFHP